MYKLLVWDKQIVAEAIVLLQITNLLLSYHINSKHWQKISHLKLADPNCNTLTQIDIIVGRDLIPQIILEGVEKISTTLLAQNTLFGWILRGLATDPVSTSTTQVDENSKEYLNSQLKKCRELGNAPHINYNPRRSVFWKLLQSPNYSIK